MYLKFSRLALAVMFCCAALTAHASYVITIDTDGADDGPWTPHANFSFGGDTTTASTSVLPALNPWLVPTVPGLGIGDSLFGGDGGALPDTYLYSYTPGIDGDSGAIAAGTALNDDGDTASGLPAGASGTYRVYAAWPQSGNISGGDTLYDLSDGGGSIASVLIDQNDDANGNDPGPDGNIKGGEWQFLYEVTLDAGTAYTLSQQPSVSNSFVSMRAGGVLFERVPEPASALFALAGIACMMTARRRS